MSNFLLPRAWWQNLDKWLTLGKEEFAWGTRGRGKLYRLTIKWISSKLSRLSLHFKSTFHWLLQVYCITQKMHISQVLAFLWITPQCMRQLFCTFSSKTLYALDKMSSSKCTFSDLRLLAWKLTKFLMSFFKPQVNFSLNIA